MVGDSSVVMISAGIRKKQESCPLDSVYMARCMRTVTSGAMLVVRKGDGECRKIQSGCRQGYLHAFPLTGYHSVKHADLAKGLALNTTTKRLFTQGETTLYQYEYSEISSTSKKLCFFRCFWVTSRRKLHLIGTTEQDEHVLRYRPCVER
jgi:hypothetical protein